MDFFDPSVWFRVVDLIGVLANGLLGGAVARSKRFDVIGFLILAMASGLGGGIVRDVILGKDFPVAFTDPFYLGCAITAAFIAYFLHLEGRWTRRALILGDLLALGCWSATGTLKGLAFGLGWLPSMLLGVITAVGGGIIRSLLVNEVPAVFGGNPLYATLAVIASAQTVLTSIWVSSTAAMGVSIVMSTILGVLSRKQRWMLPEPVTLQLALPKFRPRRLKRQELEKQGKKL